MEMVATLVIHLETLTMVAIMVGIVGMLLRRMVVGGMLGASSRRKEGRSCNVIRRFLYRPALRSHGIETGNDWEHGTNGIDAVRICTSTCA